MKKIIVITHGYPSVANTNDCPFVKELVETWRCMDICVEVIKPVKLIEFIKLLIVGKNKDGIVKYPLYFDFSFMRLFRRFPAIRRMHIRIADASFQRAVERTIKIDSNDIMYSHFLDSGFCVAALSEKYKVPSYCAVGESTLWTLEFKDMGEVRRRLKHLSGFIAVSEKNKRMLIDNELAHEDKIQVFPNGVDIHKIHRLDKRECRRELSIDENALVGAFVGHFIERKGPLRVMEATKEIDGLQMIYIGSGEQEPSGNNITFKGQVPHDMIPKYLSAADFFVLPTLAEGCCNAIIEAMACGLPIISSDLEFNDDILNEQCAIRINPEDIRQIHEAIIRLTKDKPLRIKMSEAALEKARMLSLQVRAERILGFIKYYGEENQE